MFRIVVERMGLISNEVYLVSIETIIWKLKQKDSVTQFSKENVRCVPVYKQNMSSIV